MRLAAVGLLLLLGAAVGGCAMAPLPGPEATLDNIRAIRAGGLPPLAVGSFTAAPGNPTLMDHTLVIRAGAQSAPGGSYARYLGDILTAELKGAGRFDPGADQVVTGVVTRTHLDSGLPKARAALAAKFTLVRAGRVVFEKTFAADAVWDSEIIGDVAIPDAFNHYMGLFPQLVGELLADPDFRAAARVS